MSGTVQDKEKIRITKLKGVDAFAFMKSEGSNVFITTGNGIIIGKSVLTTIIWYLVRNGLLSHKVLEGILEQFHSSEDTLDV